MNDPCEIKREHYEELNKKYQPEFEIEFPDEVVNRPGREDQIQTMARMIQFWDKRRPIKITKDAKTMTEAFYVSRKKQLLLNIAEQGGILDEVLVVSGTSLLPHQGRSCGRRQ
jgi:hypothetical protein